MALRGLDELPDVQINDAVVQHEWRHALQLIEKREKKAKRDQPIDWLTVSASIQWIAKFNQACKASILLLLPEPAKQRQGRSLLDSLYERKPPVVNVNAAMIIQAFAEQRKDLDVRIDGLWLQAANAHSNDEGMHRHWFNAKFSNKDWQGARKAAMAYMKHFPNKREPFFWAVFANFMASKSPKSSEQERNLCGAMAYRMCAKAAEDVSVHADKVWNISHLSIEYDHGTEREKALKNGRVPCTPGEVAFFLDIYEFQGKLDEALALLKSDRTGVSSRIGKRSWDLVLRRIQLSENVSGWMDLFEFCSSLLEDASRSDGRQSILGFGETGNNWSVWVAMLKAVVNLRECKVRIGDWLVKSLAYGERCRMDDKHRHPRLITAIGLKHKIPSAFSLTLDSQILHANAHRPSRIAAAVCTQRSENNKSREAMSARMLFGLNSLLPMHSTEERKVDLAEACLAYFKVYAKKQSCFDDLQIAIHGLNQSAAQSFLARVKLWCVQEHEYFSRQAQLRDLDMEPVYAPEYLIMQVNMLKLEYLLVHSRWGESGPTDGFAEMEHFIVRCIKSYISSIRSSPVDENAASPTERLPGDDAGLLAATGLIRIAMTGTHHNALLQAVIILQHLTQTSPFNYEALMRFRNPSEGSEADPVQHLSRAMDYHLHLHENDQQEILNFLEAGQYASLLQGMGNSVYNQLGFTKYMLLVEWVRTERLSGVQQKLDFRQLADQLPTQTLDNRDRCPIPHWEAPEAMSLEEMLLLGRWPSHQWLSKQLFIAQTFGVATNQHTFFERDDVLKNLSASSDLKDSSTPTENRQMDLARECDFILTAYGEKASGAKTTNPNATATEHKIDMIRIWQEDTNEHIAMLSQGGSPHLWKITKNYFAPDWEFFHTVYTGLDSCILIEKTVEVIEAQNRKVRPLEPGAAEEQTKRIRKLCDEYRAMVHAAVLELSVSLSDAKNEEELLYSIICRQGETENKDPFGYWLRYLFVGEEYVRGIVTRLQLAWKEALINIADLTRPKSSA
ncbi:MAG: hypothetical protein Q9170_000085 [Blastenia crenularia]